MEGALTYVLKFAMSRCANMENRTTDGGSESEVLVEMPVSAVVSDPGA